MPRYQHRAAQKFWAIELSGKKYTTRFGKLGSPGQTRLKTFKTDYLARADYDKVITAKLKAGYKLVAEAKPSKPATGAKAGTSNAALEQAIEADPYDTAAYAVYADFLQDQGDPRGELIALQLANKHAAATKLIAKHADYFLGPLAQHTKEYDHDYDTKRKQVRRDAFTWKAGFIHGLWLSHNVYALENSNPPYTMTGTLAEDVLRPLLAHPSGRFLAEIAIRFNGEPTSSLQDLVDVLAKHAPPTLRKLHLGDYLFAGGHHAEMHGTDTEISWYSVGNLGKLWKKVSGLTHLITQGGTHGSAMAGGIQLGTLDLPNLVHAELRTGGLSKANARAIAKAKIPKIEHLEIWYGDPDYGGDATAKDVQLLLDRTDLPALRHLGLRNAEFADRLIGQLATAKLTKQLTGLDLSLGCMTDDGARALVSQKAAFARLDKLDVSKNYLSPDGVKQLRKCFAKKLVDRGQREDPATTDDGIEYRHPAICE